MSIYINPAYVYWIHLPEHTDFLTQGYVGVSIDPEHRLYEHKSDAKRGTHHNKFLERIINKYDIIQSVIFSGNAVECYAYEEFVRPTKNIGWNLNKGGDCPPSNKGTKFTKEHCANISKSKIGKARSPMTAETKQKISKSKTGLVVSEETKNKIKEKRRHQVFSEETKRKLSISHQGKLPGNAKSIKTPIGTFTSLSQAAKAYNVTTQTMINWTKSKSEFEIMAHTLKTNFNSHSGPAQNPLSSI